MTVSDRRVDRHVGERLRERRTLLGLTLDDLAAAVGVTYQQLQKYEKGINRISAGRLYAVATRLLVPVGYFFEGIESETQVRSAENPLAAGSVKNREASEMMRLYSLLKPDIRKSLLSHVKALTRHHLLDRNGLD